MGLKIAAVSDTHAKHNYVSVPECDVLVCAGDITFRGELSILDNFLSWFVRQPCMHHVLIFGNHELGLEVGGLNRESAMKLIDDYGVTYLENSSTVIEGYKFYGSPYTPRFHDWNWNVDRGEKIAACWQLIPSDVDVLITHGPPHGILDTVLHYEGRDPHQGCEELRKRIDELKQLKLHAFGHLHKEGGQSLVIDGKTFVNCAICDDNYGATRNPIVVEI